MTIQQKKLFPKLNIYFAAFTANLCATAATCVMSWSSPTLPLITKPGEKIYITTDEGAWLSSIPALGASLGPFITGIIVDHLGRKRTLLGILLLFVGCWSVMYFCENLIILLSSRFVAGLGVGCVYATLPMFVCEISPVKLRGSLCSLLQLFDCFAYLIEYIVGSYATFQNLILISGILPILCFLILVWVPESPYYLHNKGAKSEAMQALRYFRGYPDSSTLQKEIDELEASAENIKNNKRSIITLFTTKGNLKCLYYVAALVICQQGSGINVITFYSKSIFEESGSSFSANLCSVIVAVVMTCTSIITSTAARIFKIRNLLLFSSVGITVAMFSIGTYFYFKDTLNDINSIFGWIPLFSLVLFIFAYTLGYGPLVWVITAEIFPSHLKAFGCALASSFSWLLAFLLTRYFLLFAINYGKAPAFWLFGCIGIMSYLFVNFHLPETQNKTFQEIQDMIHGPMQKKEKNNENP